MNRWEVENSQNKEIVFKINQEFFIKTSDLIKSLRKKTNGQSIKIKNLQKENEFLKQEIKDFDKYITKYIKNSEVLYHYKSSDLPVEVIYQ